MKNSHTFSRICGYAMFLLILAQIALVLVSWLITAAMPDVFPRSLLSPEGIRWFFGTFTANLQSPWLVWLLLISIAWGTLRASGLLNYDHNLKFIHVFVFIIFSGKTISIMSLPSDDGLARMPQPRRLVASPISLTIWRATRYFISLVSGVKRCGCRVASNGIS